MTPTRILLAGDLHLGRVASALPDAMPHDTRRTEHAWHALVQLAIQNRAAALCLSGDIADENNRFWEVVGPLERGAAQLQNAGISLYAIAGNHDHALLPRIAREIGPERFHLLGENGNWETATIHHNNQPVLRLVGWSFPNRSVEYDPLDTFPTDFHPDQNTSLPTLGILHGDLDAPASRYAPLDRRRLQSTAVTGWLLGHLHAPQLINETDRPFLLYPGSTQAMDPGETGAHGAWIIDVERSRIQPPRFVPLASVRYERLTVNLDRIESAAEFESTLRSTLRQTAADIADESDQRLKCISLRVTLVGRTPLFNELPTLIADWREQFDERLAGDIPLHLDRISNEAMPAIDINAAAAQASPLGEVARILLQLENDNPAPDVAQLIADARSTIDKRRAASYYAHLPEPPPVDETTAKQYLQSQARSLLDALYRQAST